MIRFRWLIWFWVALATWPARAADPAALCEAAADAAAQRFGIPAEVMRALTLTETGRGAPPRPWPWAVNKAGESHWFDTREQAIAFAEEAQASGATNFDVGCFQINFRWHAGAFASMADMFDPVGNAGYAAGYLQQKYSATGDWLLAAGAYHSATPAFAERYITRFAEYLQLPAGQAPDLRLASLSPPGNGFPLLRPGGSGRAGSLVPLETGGRRLIGD